jgi:hypothetical protein
MNRKKKPEPRIVLADGREGVRRWRTSIWYDLRLKDPSPASWGRGFPKLEVGSIETAARLVMTGRAAKVQCTDRVTGRVMWTVRKGERVPRTHVYNPIIEYGDAE